MKNKTNRFELITEKGRKIVLTDLKSVTTEIQDDGRTLKVFTQSKPKKKLKHKLKILKNKKKAYFVTGLILILLGLTANGLAQSYPSWILHIFTSLSIIVAIILIFLSINFEDYENAK